MIIKKITDGFVVQLYDSETGKCAGQKFIAGDECDYRTVDGGRFDVDDCKTELEYEPYEMVQPDTEKQPQVAIYVKGGMVQAIRSNISPALGIEIVDADCEQLDYVDRWSELQTELEFGNY
jgi:hypothetical protein